MSARFGCESRVINFGKSPTGCCSEHCRSCVRSKPTVVGRSNTDVMMSLTWLWCHSSVWWFQSVTSIASRRALALHTRTEAFLAILQPTFVNLPTELFARRSATITHWTPCVPLSCVVPRIKNNKQNKQQQQLKRRQVLFYKSACVILCRVLTSV